MVYPSWSYFPPNAQPPGWVHDMVGIVAAQEAVVSTVQAGMAKSSDDVLAQLAPGLLGLGYVVETGKKASEKIRRPVLFGENGVATVSYDVDAAHDEHGVVVEVEAGRAARSNAAYRDIVRTSLILDARYLALLLPVAYRYGGEGKESAVHVYRETLDQLRAIYASQRLPLPFEGVLLLGY